MRTENLLDEAHQERAKFIGPLASDFTDVVEVLRDHKHFTWEEVRVWLAFRGLPFSTAALQAAWHKHKRRRST